MALRELAGDPVPNGRGGFFDHIHEMKDSYKGLKKAKRRLEGTLNNPSLGETERIVLESALKTTNKHIKRIDKLFKQYGGEKCPDELSISDVARCIRQDVHGNRI